MALDLSIGSRAGRGLIALKKLAAGLITSVDSNFTLAGGQLQHHTIASGNVLGVSGGSTAEPTSSTMTAMLDRAFGSTEGQILQRGALVWQVLAPGSHSGQVLTSGGAAALNAWGSAMSALTFGGSLNNCSTTSVPVMGGLNATFTPGKTGNGLLFLSFAPAVGVAAQFGECQINFGTGTPPTAGAAPTGTQLSGTILLAVTASGLNFATVVVPFFGLTVGTTYWLDYEFTFQSVAMLSIGCANTSVNGAEF